MVASIVYFKNMIFITFKMKGIQQFVAIMEIASPVSQPERRIVHHCLFYYVNFYNFSSLPNRIDS